MSHITKQERIGLDELFTAIDKHRYHSKWSKVSRVMKSLHKQQKRFLIKSIKGFR